MLHPICFSNTSRVLNSNGLLNANSVLPVNQRSWWRGMAVGLLSTSLLVSTPTLARVSVSLGYSGGYDSNRSLSESGDSVTTHSLFSRITGSSQGSRLSSVLDFSLGYQDGTDVDGRALGTGGLSLEYIIKPSRLSWEVNDTLSRTLIDSSGSSVDPDNNDLRNTFSTGPVLTFDITPRNNVTVRGNFTRTTHAEQDIADTQEQSGHLVFTHLISRISESGVTYSYLESELVDFPENVTQLENSALFFNTRRQRMTLNASIGYGRDIQNDFHTDTNSLQLGFKLNSTWDLTLSTDSALTTASSSAEGDLLAQANLFTVTALSCQQGTLPAEDCQLANRLNQAGQLQGGFLLNDAQLAEALFSESSGAIEIERQSAILTWRTDSLSTLSFSIFESERTDIQDASIEGFRDPNRQESNGAALLGSYAVSDRTSFGFSLTHTVRETTDVDDTTANVEFSETTEDRLILNLGYNLTRNVDTRFNLSYAEAERTNTAVDVSGGDGYGVGWMIVWTL